MADCKVISATAKEPVVSVSDGAKVATVEVREIIANVQSTSISSNTTEQCIQTNLSGFGEEWIPDSRLFKYNQEILSLADTISLTMLYARSFAEFSALQDAVRLNPGKNLVETLNAFVDTAIFNAIKGVEETVFTSETLQFAAGFNRYFSENSQYFSADYTLINDQYVRDFRLLDTALLSLTKPFTEAFGVSDTVTKTTGLGKNETVALTETFLASVTFNRTLQDWVVSTDDVYGEANIDDDQTAFIGKVLLEQMSYIDQMIFSIAKGIVDSVSSQDPLTWAMSTVRSDLSYFTDTTALTSSKVLSDINVLSDTLSSVVSFFRTPADLVTPVETLSFINSAILQPDFANPQSIVAKTIGIILDESDYFLQDYTQPDYEAGALTLLDLVTIQPSKAVVDTLGLSDTLLGLETGKILSDVSAVSETFIKNFSSVLADTSAASDLASKLLAISKTDTAAMSDAVSFQFTYGRALSDSSTFGETKTANLQNYFGSNFVSAGFVGTNYTL